MLKLRDIWQALIGPGEGILGASAQREISAVVIDSRTASAGTLFVALRGEHTDGHLYLADAFKRGAQVAVAESQAVDLCEHATFVRPDGSIQRHEPLEITGRARPGDAPLVFLVPDALKGLQQVAAYWRQQMPALAVGITGSVGKTTTKEIVANVLAQRYVTLRSEGNLNNEIGLPLTLLRLTPAHERLVVEMGMYATGEITRLCELARPRIGVVTNVGPVHLERLGSIERIAQAKAELPQALPPAAAGGVAVLNGDDARVRAMAEMTQARVLTYGLSPNSDLWADDILSLGLEGVRFRFHYGAEAFHVRLPLLGRHSVHTALRAAAVGLADGLSWTEIIAGLQDLRGQLRLMVVPGVRDTTLIDDTYNASPDSVLAALNLLNEIANSTHRAVAVLGDMHELGNFEEQGHRLVGGRAAQIVQKLIAVGERARWIAEEAVACGMHTADVYAVVCNDDAIAILQGMLCPGDIVLVKGSRAATLEVIVDALSRPRAAGADAV